MSSTSSATTPDHPLAFANAYRQVGVHSEVGNASPHRLIALLTEQQTAFNAAQAGRTLNVLFDKPGRHGRQAVGRSPYLQSVHVDDADHLIGQIVPVQITAGQQNSLSGQLLTHGLKQPSAEREAVAPLEKAC